MIKSTVNRLTLWTCYAGLAVITILSVFVNIGWSILLFPFELFCLLCGTYLWERADDEEDDDDEA